MNVFFAVGGVLACAGLAAWAYGERRMRGRLEAKIIRLKNDLDRTSKILIEKNLELSDQNVSQQKQLESKDGFISIISHQLRTPITEVRWAMQAILRDDSSQLLPKQRTALEGLYGSVEHMINIINDIVELVSVEQNSVRVDTLPYSPDSVVEAVAARTAEEFKSKNISLSVQLGCRGVVDSIDKDSLTMIVSNLLENAYHYTPNGGAITVESGRGEQDAYIVSVSDTGMGMSPQQQKNVFTKFKRSNEAIQANALGSGLGLYIVKNILDAHGGKISFTSDTGKGTSFVCTIPARKK